MIYLHFEACILKNVSFKQFNAVRISNAFKDIMVLADAFMRTVTPFILNPILTHLDRKINIKS